MLFSLIIPVYNRAKFLERSLQSVLALQYRPLEVILVDNGSTDSSYSLCQKFAQKHGNKKDFCVKVVEADKKRGASYARNVGARLAQGAYLYFFDSDDEMSSGFLEEVSDVFQEEGELDMVAARTMLITEDGRQIPRKVYKNVRVSDQILTGMLSTQSMVFKKAFFNTTDGWDERLPRWNDWELGVRMLLKRPRLRWLDGTYHRIHAHADSITGTSFSASAAQLHLAITIVRNQLQTDCDKTALWYRQAILAAEMKKEGSNEAAQTLLSEALGQPLPIRHKAVIRFLYHYTVLGGRGAWFMARRMLW